MMIDHDEQAFLKSLKIIFDTSEHDFIKNMNIWLSR